MDKLRIIFFIGVAIVAGIVHGTSSGSSSVSHSIKIPRTAAISDLRKLLKNDFTADYMAEDHFLTKWLSKANFNVEDAAQIVREYLRWRAELNLDTILDEDWTDMRTRFPYSRQTTDKTGRPVFYIDAGNWDVSSFLAEGQDSYDRLVRYVLMYVEESEAHVRQLREKGESSKNFVSILNAGGLSATKHVCIQCLYLYRDLSNLRTRFAPPEEEKLVILNVPYFFKTVYDYINTQPESYMTLYGQDQSQWEKHLLEFMHKDQFPNGILNELPVKDNLDGFLNWSKEL